MLHDECERCGLKYMHVREVTVEYKTGPACPKCAVDTGRGREAVPMLYSEPDDWWKCWHCKHRFKMHKADDGCRLSAAG